MNNGTQLVLSLLCGTALGALFFGGLWWTLQQLPTAKRPALLMLASSSLRMGVVVSGMYLCVRVGVIALLLCLTGLVLARVLLTRALRASADYASVDAGRQDTGHAP